MFSSDGREGLSCKSCQLPVNWLQEGPAAGAKPLDIEDAYGGSSPPPPTIENLGRLCSWGSAERRTQSILQGELLCLEDSLSAKVCLPKPSEILTKIEEESMEKRQFPMQNGAKMGSGTQLGRRCLQGGKKGAKKVRIWSGLESFLAPF